MEIPEIPERTKETLTRLYNQINPAQLKREMEKLQNKLIDLSVAKKKTTERIKESAKTGGLCL